MSEYGYIPEAPEQSFGNNKGIFKPKDIYDLTRADKYTNYGQLELIETKTASSVSSVTFDDIKSDVYDTHFLTFHNFSPSVNQSDFRIRFFESGVEETSAVYDYAQQYQNTSGVGNGQSTTSSSYLRATGGVGDATHRIGNGCIYFYNLGDSTKYSFTNYHSNFTDQTNTFYSYPIGCGLLHQTSYVDQIKFFVSSGTFSAGLSLYGIKEYS